MKQGTINMSINYFQYLIDPYPKWFFEKFKDVQEILINGEKYLSFPHGELCGKGDYVLSIGSYMIPLRKEDYNNGAENI